MKLKKVLLVMLWLCPVAIFIVAVLNRPKVHTNARFNASDLTAPPHPRNEKDGVSRAISEAIYQVMTIPNIASNGIPQGGDPKLQSLLTWVYNDATNYPGKSFHQLSYCAIIGAGDPTDNDGKTLVMDLGKRSVPVTLIFGRQNLGDTNASSQAYLIGTYLGGGQHLELNCSLRWKAKSQNWGVIYKRGPTAAQVRD